MKTFVALAVFFALFVGTAQADDGLTEPANGTDLAGGQWHTFSWVDHAIRPLIVTDSYLIFSQDPSAVANAWLFAGGKGVTSRKFESHSNTQGMWLDSRFTNGTWYWSICDSGTTSVTQGCSPRTFAEPMGTRTGSFVMTKPYPPEITKARAIRAAKREIGSFKHAFRVKIRKCVKTTFLQYRCRATWLDPKFRNAAVVHITARGSELVVGVSRIVEKRR